MDDSSSPDPFIDYYQLIGVGPTASAEQIDKAIKDKRRKVRKQTGSPVLEKRQQAEQTMGRLATAQKTLLDAQARSDYDERYRIHRGGSAGDASPADGSPGEPPSANGAAPVGDVVHRIRAALDQADFRTAGVLTAEAVRTYDTAEVWGLHAQVLSAVNQHVNAVGAGRKAVDRDPGNPDYHYQLALDLSAAGDNVAAMSAYEAVERLAPDNPLGRVGRAQLLWSVGEEQAALEILEPLSRRFGDHPLVAELYALALASKADKVPNERYSDGSTYITSDTEIEQMSELLQRAIRQPFDDPELRGDLEEMHKEVISHRDRKFVFILFTSLRWTFFWWVAAWISTVTAVATIGLTVDWLLIALGVDGLVAWRAYAPQWRHNKRRRNARIEHRIMQSRLEQLRRELGQL
jgi:tetratricopeptide (TPR) repeat protein